jgi:hypothetical protein
MSVERVIAGQLAEYEFSSISFTTDHIVVKATSEANARRKAMIEIYGSIPDRVCPHAPAYEGRGLGLMSVKPIMASGTNPAS